MSLRDLERQMVTAKRDRKPARSGTGVNRSVMVGSVLGKAPTAQQPALPTTASQERLLCTFPMRPKTAHTLKHAELAPDDDATMAAAQLARGKVRPSSADARIRVSSTATAAAAAAAADGGAIAGGPGGISHFGGADNGSDGGARDLADLSVFGEQRQRGGGMPSSSTSRVGAAQSLHAAVDEPEPARAAALTGSSRTSSPPQSRARSARPRRRAPRPPARRLRQAPCRRRRRRRPSRRIPTSFDWTARRRHRSTSSRSATTTTSSPRTTRRCRAWARRRRAWAVAVEARVALRGGRRRGGGGGQRQGLHVVREPSDEPDLDGRERLSRGLRARVFHDPG